MVKRILTVCILSFLTMNAAVAETFDHSLWDTLLKAHVTSINEAKASVVDYQAMTVDRIRLKYYLRSLSTIEQHQFDQWSKQSQLAFLINAYNAWTVELILTAWPDLDSIKDLGGIFRSPWDKAFIQLLGKTRSLNDIEHNLIREDGRYNDPRIHFAVNCASIGCPALRREAYTGEALDTQLNEQTQLFLSDRERNRINGDGLALSSIFKWYKEDFEKGWLGFNSLEDFLLAYRAALQLPKKIQLKLKAHDITISYLAYDWRLNE